MADGEGPVVDFNVAEVCASAAVNDILASCSQELYKSYIQRKAFPYTAERMSDLLMRELRLCFVRHDRGEDKEARLPNDPPEEWGLEPEPKPCKIDVWARSCVPVRKKYVRSKDDALAAAAANRIAKGAAGSKSAGLKNASSPEGGGQAQGGLRGQTIALTEEQYEDEEEAWMRDVKEKEAKRKREDEARIKRKALEEAEEAEKLLKVKGDMQTKPIAYDTDGNIIWVTPMAAEKLPNPTPSLNFKFKGGHPTGPGDHEAGVRNLRSGGGAASAKRGASKAKKKPDNQQFTDSFQRLSSQQPPMMDVMHVAPGVVLGERGRLKKGEKKDENKTLSRKDYQDMLAAERQSGVPAGSTTDADEAAGISMTVESSVPDSRDVPLTPGASQQQVALSGRVGPEDGIPARGGAPPKAEQDFGGGGLPAPAGGFVPQRPAAPPPAVHNPRARMEAIGWRRGERDRVPTSGAPAAGIRNYFPPPPIGATMGHGLMPKSPAEREKEFFFPDEEDVPEAGDSADDELMTPVIAKRIIEVESPKSHKMGGSIQAPNRDLLKRLFR